MYQKAELQVIRLINATVFVSLLEKRKKEKLYVKISLNMYYLKTYNIKRAVSQILQRKWAIKPKLAKIP